jgi:hypothetical protein
MPLRGAGSITGETFDARPPHRGVTSPESEVTPPSVPCQGGSCIRVGGRAIHVRWVDVLSAAWCPASRVLSLVC